MNAAEHGIAVTFDRLTFVKGEKIRVVARLPCQKEPAPIQFEMGRVAVLNPHWVLTQSGTLPGEHDGNYTIEMDTSNFSPGFYELGRVQIGPNSPDPAAASMTYLGSRDFPRCVVQIREAEEPALDEKDILTLLVATEAAIEEAFLSPSDSRTSAEEEARLYTVAWFVKDLLVKTPMRFDRFQLVPTGRGLNAHDSIDFVNDFFNTHTSIPLQFQYNEDEDRAAQNASPVCAVCFPNVIAKDADQAVQYCAHHAQMLVLALSISRDAGGHLFGAVVVDLQANTAFHYPQHLSYRGNLMGGLISGENPEEVGSLIQGLELNDTNRFLASLFREAQREPNNNFQYVRYWQILETMAEGRNYNPKDPLMDYDGSKIKSADGNDLTVKGSTAIVFNMLREANMTSISEMWKHVNIWFALRNTVAHFGAIDKYEQLDSVSRREWARMGMEEIRNTGTDRYLMGLKRHVKWMLMHDIQKTT